MGVVLKFESRLTGRTKIDITEAATTYFTSNAVFVANAKIL